MHLIKGVIGKGNEFFNRTEGADKIEKNGRLDGLVSRGKLQ